MKDQETKPLADVEPADQAPKVTPVDESFADFVPQDPFADEQEGVTDPKVIEPEKTPEPIKSDSSEPEPDKDKAEEPSKLREEMARINGLLEEEKAQSKVWQDEKSTLQEQYEAKLAEIEEIQTRQKQEIEKRSESDVYQHPDVRKVESDLIEEQRNVAQVMGGREGKQFIAQGEARSLIEQFSSVGDLDDDGYEDRYDEFESYIQDRYPDNYSQVKQWIASAIRGKKEQQKIVEGLKANAKSSKHGEELSSYEQSVKYLNSLKSDWKTPDATLIETSPNHPHSILHAISSESDEFSGIDDEIIQSIAPKITKNLPLKMENYESMSDDQLEQYQSQVTALDQKKRATLERDAFYGAKALKVLPSVYKELKELRDQVAKSKDAEPSFEADNAPEGSKPKQIDDFSQFTPQDANIDSIFGG